MKAPALLFACLMSCSTTGSGQFPNVSPVTPTVPRPPDVEHGSPIDQPQEANARSKSRPIDPARAKRDAEELVKLAQSIPPKIELVTKGQLPKDLNEQLKRIEKLSKQLRRELSR